MVVRGLLKYWQYVSNHDRHRCFALRCGIITTQRSYALQLHDEFVQALHGLQSIADVHVNRAPWCCPNSSLSYPKVPEHSWSVNVLGNYHHSREISAAMTLRETYYTMAKACAHIAKKMRDPEERVAMLEIAQSYMKLGDRFAARLERGTAHRADDQDDGARKDR